MGKTSRRSSEDHSTRKRHYRRGSSSPRRSATPDKGTTNDLPKNKSLGHRGSRRDATNGKNRKSRSRTPPRNTKHRSPTRSPSYSRSRSPSEPNHVMTRRMSMQQHQQLANPLIDATKKAEGDFDNFPEITQRSRELLRARGINCLFPV
jgi:hypothetical protein